MSISLARPRRFSASCCKVVAKISCSRLNSPMEPCLPRAGSSPATAARRWLPRSKPASRTQSRKPICSWSVSPRSLVSPRRWRANWKISPGRKKSFGGQMFQTENSEIRTAKVDTVLSIAQEVNASRDCLGNRSWCCADHRPSYAGASGKESLCSRSYAFNKICRLL